MTWRLGRGHKGAMRIMDREPEPNLNLSNRLESSDGYMYIPIYVAIMRVRPRLAFLAHDSCAALASGDEPDKRLCCQLLTITSIIEAVSIGKYLIVSRRFFPPSTSFPSIFGLDRAVCCARGLHARTRASPMLVGSAATAMPTTAVHSGGVMVLGGGPGNLRMGSQCLRAVSAELVREMSAF